MKERECSTGSIILDLLPIQFLPPERVPQVQGSSKLKMWTSQSQTSLDINPANQVSRIKWAGSQDVRRTLSGV
jgi:hypothetical protein